MTADEARYSGPKWLEANRRIRAHPQAAHLIVGRYSPRHWRDARRTAVCAAGLNTPLWQEAVAAAYPPAALPTPPEGDAG